MTYLFIWTFVGSQALGSVAASVTHYDWRPMGGFDTGAACHKAAQQLNISAEKHRCIRVDGVLQ